MTVFLLLRITHVLLGVFWAGTVFFSVQYLVPSMRAAGPGALAVLQGMKQRGYFTALPIIAGLTLLSGFSLYMERMMAGGREYAAVWRATGEAMAYNVGAVAGVLAFIIGMIWMRPSTLAMIRLGEQLKAAAPGAEREALEAEMGRVRARSWKALQGAAAALLVAVLAMAVARYM